MPTVGVDCDIYLQHADVNDGDPVGFLLYRKKTADYGPEVQVHYESYTDTLGGTDDIRHLWFTVVLANDLINPDGSFHQETALFMRNALIDILMKHSEITLNTPAGLITGLKSSGHVMIHSIFPGWDTIECNLTTDSVNYAPVDSVYYEASFWVDLTTYTGIMTWDNSYWRT